MRKGAFGSGHKIRLAGLFCVIAALLAATFPTAVLAEGSFNMSTAYPSITDTAGSSEEFDLDFLNSGDAVTVDLSVTGLPEGWSGYFEGGGNEISSVHIEASDELQTSLASYILTIPDEAEDGEYTITLKASGDGVSASVPINVNVNALSVGADAVTTEHADQEGYAGSSFTFSTVIENNSAEEQTYALSAVAPSGWTINFTQDSTRVTSATVAAHSSGTITANVTTPEDVAAGTYSIPVSIAGKTTLTSEYTVTITGSYGIELYTADQVLSFNARANQQTAVNLTVYNTGNIDLEDVTVSASAPSGWTVEFSTASIATLAAGESQEITMYVTPSGEALSGDYEYAVSAKCDDASVSKTFRVTVKTKTSWGIFSIALIVVIALCLTFIFKKFGRH